MTATETIADIRTVKHLLIQNRTEAEECTAILADRRKSIDAAIAEIERQYEADNFNLMLQLKEATQFVADYDAHLRRFAIEHYEETGEKRLDADCSVRVNTKYQYEQAAAVAWAETNAPIMIVKSVDKKAFESLPKIADLEFVEKVETPIAVIASTFTEI